ncbi:unnamed protein product [Aspergillus oryzae]|uniref:Unnamed protein product n=2 Tax=Aspergillus oryzae TaxID=5062 RepID=A0AAN5C007_ASPOZ|nr:unnamed protein product [Aspergillus oryzae]GMF89910.1 unnamed protein product [Aspergillus oryzae]GMG12172.1 unnamed protein product [Aspergillus oryzae]GMG33576.1 unnamed protein product [Aspergillus oryzae]GMG42059.1 unnamed protein product [Aspergillus oryzae var. brunneus]
MATDPTNQTNPDPDGDSQMASSPESSHMHSEDSPVGSRTPTNMRSATSQFPGTSELSPPGSQTQSVSADVGGLAGLGNTNTSGGSAEMTSAQQQQQQPGASWMNKRAEEEYHRAMEYVIDQDFNLGGFYFAFWLAGWGRYF